MYTLGRVLSRLTDLTTIVGGLAIALMMLHISLDVVLRHFFNAPLPGTITIVSYYYMIVAAFVPLAFAEQKNGHISVEVLTERLPDWLEKHLAGWIYLFSASVFALLAWRMFEEATRRHDMGASVIQGGATIPIWPTYYVLPLGAGLMVLVLAYKFLAYISGARSGLDEARARPDAPVE